jgi:hypothetical protein
MKGGEGSESGLISVSTRKEGIAQGAIDESQHGKMVDPRFYAEN